MSRSRPISEKRCLFEQFLEGNRRRYTATFKVPDANGALTDPSTVTFYRRKLGSGLLTDRETYVYGTDVAVVRDSVGVFHIDLSYSDDGRYTVAAKGPAPVRPTRARCRRPQREGAGVSNLPDELATAGALHPARRARPCPRLRGRQRRGSR